MKAFVFFRGRTIVFKDRGEILLLKFAQELADYGIVEQLPKLEGRVQRLAVAVLQQGRYELRQGGSDHHGDGSAAE